MTTSKNTELNPTYPEQRTSKNKINVMLKYLHEINLHLNPFWRYHLQSSNIQIK